MLMLRRLFSKPKLNKFSFLTSSKKTFITNNRFNALRMMNIAKFNTLKTYNFSTQQNLISPIEYMKDLEIRKYDTQTDMRQELEDLNTHFSNFQGNIIIINLEEGEGKIDDIEATVKYLDSLIIKMRSMRSPPLSEFIVTLNNCIEKTDQLEPYNGVWEKIEKL